jgi:hypothetical protein
MFGGPPPGAVLFFFLLVAAFFGAIGYMVYFVFKIHQFVIQAINLYKDMVNRQDMMIRLLQDIRVGNKTFDHGELSVGNKGSKCRKCGESSAADSKYCDNCGAQLTA